MKLELNGDNISTKNISQKEWQNKLSSKIKEIEVLIKNNDLEEKQKTLEIQKNNAYYKLEKIGKELENVENFLEEENDENIENEESLKIKINDIRQKNITIQDQLNIIKGYYNFINKYKTKQIKEKKDLNNEINKIKNEIQNNKCFSKMTDEEKIILDKTKQLDDINKDIENLLKKIEEKKTQKYIRNVRLKQLKYLTNTNNKKSPKKEIKTKKNNNSVPKKSQTNKKVNNKKTELGEIIDNIVPNHNQNSNRKANNETKVESTFDIINRRIPFTISSLDNLINDQNNDLFKDDKKKINQKNYSMKKNTGNNKKKSNDIIRLEKENIKKIISSTENKNIINSNDNFNKNKNNVNYDNNNFKNNNIKTNNIINNNKVSDNKIENINKNLFDEDNPLGWLENDNNNKINVNNNFSHSNNINNINENNNYNVNNNNIDINDNKDEKYKINNVEDNKNEINSNDKNNKNVDLSEVKGLFGRRRPFAAIKF